MAAMLPVKKSDSIFGAIERMKDRVTKRAYELFENRGFVSGHDLDDWLTAERELVWAPPVEVEEGDREITVKVPVAGVDAEDLDVELSSQDLLVEGETHERHDKKKGKSRSTEARTAKVFRSVHLPKPVDPESARAELKDGTLTLTAKLAEAKARDVPKLKIATA